MSKINEPKVCPRCGYTDFRDVDCGPDSWDDDIFYISYVCKKCSLWYDGWKNKWLVLNDGSNVTSWQETDSDFSRGWQPKNGFVDQKKGDAKDA